MHSKREWIILNQVAEYKNAPAYPDVKILVFKLTNLSKQQVTIDNPLKSLNFRDSALFNNW